MRAALLLVAVVVLIAGCGKKEPPPDVIKPQRDAMDKAKAVSDMLQKSADERRDQTDQK